MKQYIVTLKGDILEVEVITTKGNVLLCKKGRKTYFRVKSEVFKWLSDAKKFAFENYGVWFG